MADDIHFKLNGQPARLAAAGGGMLLFALRNELGLKGPRFGCGEGHCGACMVLVDGRPANACDLPTSAAAGTSVVTPEGLGATPEGQALQRAFIELQAGQCGYCLSGVLISAAALLRREARPTETQVRSALDRHLCRCGTHQRIVRAVLSAAAELADA